MLRRLDSQHLITTGAKCRLDNRIFILYLNLDCLKLVVNYCRISGSTLRPLQISADFENYHFPKVSQYVVTNPQPSHNPINLGFCLILLSTSKLLFLRRNSIMNIKAFLLSTLFFLVFPQRSIQNRLTHHFWKKRLPILIMMKVFSSPRILPTAQP